MKVKIVASVLSATLVLSSIGGSYALANSSHMISTGVKYTSYENADITNHDLYKRLTKDKQKEFMEIVKGTNLNYQQQVQLLKDRENMGQEQEKTLKVSLIKKAAKILAAKLGEKSIADIADYLFDWEDNLQQGIENYLVDKAGWNTTVAHWTAKTIMFILF
ncbi:hypothetical protein B7C51_07950 [Paenibacillus larvae subsp. pulvifaciens]|uniref:Uncharacterized protein n=1 Tax=Paenibacillus larvae subsp. pulvifaciens TaxID=1477 RepID=A0A1V0UR72_9BACL|nr:hypothetical protein [Paenibacillus larvae]ARF67779.1 hypothetical protein B7C51_07950 [Paenibacillus larvae subsp. pulvifaciens]